MGLKEHPTSLLQPVFSYWGRSTSVISSLQHNDLPVERSCLGHQRTNRVERLLAPSPDQCCLQPSWAKIFNYRAALTLMFLVGSSVIEKTTNKWPKKLFQRKSRILPKPGSDQVKGAENWGLGTSPWPWPIEKVMNSKQVPAWVWCKLRNNPWRNQEKQVAS